MLTKLKENKKELVILAVLLVISGVAHGYNMFHFPYFENDEGTYMSQAWSLLTQGKLAPYTYWYDHAPGGWILIAIWNFLTGGFFTFGFSLNSGRVLMLILHLFSTAFLFGITRRLTNNNLTAILATLIFALSPLGIYFQRRLLLDNIMVFWLLLSLLLILGDRRKLSHFIGSAITFGIAILTKETAIFFLPAFLYIIYANSYTYHRSFVIVKWLSISFALLSLYILYALLNGEFFPSGSFLGGDQPHVSLLETIKYQASRTGGLFFDPDSAFRINLINHWLARDSLIIFLGVIATLVNLVLAIKYVPFRYLSAIVLSYWLYLIRGGLVIEFYVIPLVPLLALSIALMVGQVSRVINHLPAGQVLKYLPFLVCVGLFGFYYSDKLDIYTKDQTSAQLAAVRWIEQNVPSDAILLIDNYAYVDLQRTIPASIYIPRVAHYYWKADRDPEIKIALLKNDWRNIDYLLVTPQMQYDLFHANPSLGLAKTAYENSTVVKRFNGYGWDVEIRVVKKGVKAILSSSWGNYKTNFIKSNGQIIDPSNDTTTSEGQSYAMLRAVWQDDKATFDGVWAWTKDHLQSRTGDRLFSWLWEKGGDGYKLGDSATASDADQDIAVALLFASKRWGDVSYLSAAKEIINDIWEEEVIKVRGRYYLAAWADTEQDGGYLINPSYLSPATYKIFSEVDTKHHWVKLVDDSYFLLNKLGTQKDNKTYLPPNWVLLDKKTGEIKSATGILGEDADFYGFDAFRVMWRVALDAVWFKEPRAIEYLGRIKPFFAEQWEKDREFAAIYDLNGNKRVSFSSLSTSTGVVSVFTIKDTELVQEVYTQLFESKYQYDGGYWDDQNNYYDQNWAWFGTALYSDNLSNLWED